MVAAEEVIKESFSSTLGTGRCLTGAAGGKAWQGVIDSLDQETDAVAISLPQIWP